MCNVQFNTRPVKEMGVYKQRHIAFIHPACPRRSVIVDCTKLNRMGGVIENK